MKIIARVLSLAALASGLLGCIGAPIELTAQTEQRLRTQPPIRFLLTFDDGPSASSFWNPSMGVLDALAQNPVQPGIKAIFFVRSEEHTSELQSLMRISYAVFCLNKKKYTTQIQTT